jgi:UDP:flavonoid glycosyltransferase YjiC (YdhE family)
VEKLIVPTLEAFQNSDCLVVVTTGGSGTEELRKRYGGDNILIEDFIPFGDIMPHADVYVTNGGYGGVLLSVQHQLPMVVAGVHEGKNEINARVGYFRLGINLKTEKPSVLQLRKAVEEILANDTYFENVKSLSQEFRKFNPNEILVRQVSRLLRFSHKKNIKDEAFIY